MGRIRRGYPVTMSDWINYFKLIISSYENSFRNSTNNIFLIGAISLSLFSFSLSVISLALIFAEQGFELDISPIINLIYVLAGVLVFATLVIFGISIYQRTSRSSRYKNASSLLKQIMKGEITDPKIVRDKWFNE